MKLKDGDDLPRCTCPPAFPIVLALPGRYFARLLHKIYGHWRASIPLALLDYSIYPYPLRLALQFAI